MSRSLRWTQEQYEQHAARASTSPTHAGAGQGCVQVLPGLRLSSDRDDMIAEYLCQLKYAGLELPESEYRFDSRRRWRADFAWPDEMVLAEYEGGVYTGGAHTRGKHYESDCEKYSVATILGFKLIRFTHGMVRSGLALRLTERALGHESDNLSESTKYKHPTVARNA